MAKITLSVLTNQAKQVLSRSLNDVGSVFNVKLSDIDQSPKPKAPSPKPQAQSLKAKWII